MSQNKFDQGVKEIATSRTMQTILKVIAGVFAFALLCGCVMMLIWGGLVTSILSSLQ